MSIDIAAVRAQTPACTSLIHFNNAGAALSPQGVTAALIAHLELEQQIGAYEAAVVAAPAVEDFYGALAQMLGCSTREIAYAENATQAWNSLVNAIDFAPGERIITGQSEYASNYLTFLHLAKRQGVRIEVIPNDSAGLLDLERLEAAITADVKLIALTHVPSQCGVIHPAAEVGRIAKKHGILYLLDACQSAGQMALDVGALGCDMLTGTGRKYLRGPRGTGFLYLNKDCKARLEPAAIDLHAAQWLSAHSYRLREDARRFEHWECFVAGKIGLGRAVRYALEIGLPAIETRVQQLAHSLREQLAEIAGVTLYEHGAHLSGIVTFTTERMAAAQLHAILQEQAVNSSVTKLSNSQLDLATRAPGDVNRASVHYYNTEEEVLRFCELLRQL